MTDAWLDSEYFPSPQSASAEGILSVGGDLTVERLLDAYCHGIFPWPVRVEDFDEDLLVWWSPDPRAIIDWDRFRIPRRLIRKMRNSNWLITSNTKFEEVVYGCASDNFRKDNTWITTEIMEAYEALHDAGHAHSVEVLEGSTLVGGVYGVAIGGMFAAESMFYRRSDASKVALAALVDHLRIQGFHLFDIQQMTPHLKSLGAVSLERNQFLSHLKQAIAQPVTFGALHVELASVTDSIMRYQRKSDSR